jgi:hypothetical protein
MKPIWLLSLIVLLAQLIAIATQGAARPKGSADFTNWNSLQKLAPGDEVRIVLRNRKSYQGEFHGLSDEAIVVRLDKDNRTFARQDVSLVSTKGKSHRLRNTLIGAAAGAGAGFGFGAAVDGAGNCSFICFAGRYQGREIFTPSFAVIGAIVGGALPARKWRWLEVYHAR